MLIYAVRKVKLKQTNIKKGGQGNGKRETDTGNYYRG